MFFVVKRRQNNRKDVGVNQQQQQRIDERPEEPEDGTAIARLEIARDERLNQAAIAQQVS